MYPGNVKDINKGEKYDKLCENDLESLKKHAFALRFVVIIKKQKVELQVK